MSSVVSHPAIAMADGIGSLFYYSGLTAVSKGMINTFYGLSGMAYNGTRTIESAVFTGSIDNEAVSKNWGEVKKHLMIALPGVAMVVAGVGLRTFGTYIQSDAVHDVVKSWVK